jgi:transposase-like protein
MGRKPKVQRSAEEKLTIVMEALKSGNVAETCRKFEIAPNLFYRWKDEVEKGALAALGGEAQPRALTRSRSSASSNWSGPWGAARYRSRY